MHIGAEATSFCKDREAIFLANGLVTFRCGKKLQGNFQREIFGRHGVGNTSSIFEAAHVWAKFAWLYKDVFTVGRILAQYKGVNCSGINFVEVVGNDALQAEVVGYFIAVVVESAKVKVLQPGFAALFSASNGVEVFFNRRSKAVVNKSAEVFFKQTNNREGRPCRNKCCSFFTQVVAAVNHGGNNGSPC